jgi:Holliday junction resolvase
MVNKNFRSGTAYEARFLAGLLRNEDAVKGGRFYASKGITDVWWVDIKGVHNEAQLKFSSKKKPYISPHELEDLKRFARKMKGFMKVWLVKKQSRQKQEMELLS